MSPEERTARSAYRLTHAERMLDDAKAAFHAGRYASSINRSYYAAFHGMNTLLALDGMILKRHSGVISEFRRRYIGTGIISANISIIIGELFTQRNNCDYRDFYTPTHEEVSEMLHGAETVVESVKTYLQSRNQ